MKLVGYINMKNKDGKVLFVVGEAGANNVVGQSTDKIFVYDDVAKSVNEGHIGKNIEVQYGCGYSGKAFVSGINIK